MNGKSQTILVHKHDLVLFLVSKLSRSPFSILVPLQVACAFNIVANNLEHSFLVILLMNDKNFSN